MELKNKIEVIQFNMRTKERSILQFDEYYQAIGFIKSRRKMLAEGVVLVLSDTSAMIKYMSDNGGLM